MKNSSDVQFEQRARALYHEATHHIDPVMAGRLRAARRTALQAASTTTAHHHRARVLWPVSALAAVALAALMVWQPSPRPEADTTVATPVTANAVAEQDNELPLPPGAESTDPSLYQNLDFYGWLAASGDDKDQH